MRSTSVEAKEIQQEILRELASCGCRGSILPAGHLVESSDGLKSRHRQGLFDETFYQERLACFDFCPPEDFRAASLVIVAVPQRMVRVVFHGAEQPHDVLLPPTYSHYPDKKVEKLIKGILDPGRFQVVRAALPLKDLAARSGLGEYGRNNICYVPGMGSFHRLMAYYTDLPCVRDTWQEPRMLETCRKCLACQKNCPTGAINPHRFLLQAERCLTFLNERPGDFPEWIAPSWHNCLIGCMHCQRVCPENQEFLDGIEWGGEFSGEETALILAGTLAEGLPAVTREKLEKLGLSDELEVLPRNLQALLDQKR